VVGDFTSHLVAGLLDNGARNSLRLSSPRDRSETLSSGQNERLLKQHYMRAGFARHGTVEGERRTDVLISASRRWFQYGDYFV
jgi:hypothetical protein